MAKGGPQRLPAGLVPTSLHGAAGVLADDPVRGAIEQDGVTYGEAKPFRPQRVGGVVRITPIGAIIAVDLLKQEGIAVDVLPT